MLLVGLVVCGLFQSTWPQVIPAKALYDLSKPVTYLSSLLFAEIQNIVKGAMGSHINARVPNPIILLKVSQYWERHL